MGKNTKNVLLISMPFAGIEIPSIQLAVLEGYLKERNINIESKHLYLRAAEFYGLQNYSFLIEPPNAPYKAQMVFSSYVFPDHWNKNMEKFRKYFLQQTPKDKEINQFFSFDQYVERTDQFYQWVLGNVDWQPYDIIGFTLNYGQFLPSLAIAKKVKEMWPEKKIILGGSRTIDQLGIKVLKTFDFIDYIVTGDGEEALYQLATDYTNYRAIPNLIYKNGNEIKWNKADAEVDLNSLPNPSYDPFFEQLSKASLEVRYLFSYSGKLPIEISRGCWWNKCTFCNLNVQYSNYREKNIEKIIQEISFLADRYKVLQFQIIGNTLPRDNYKDLFEKIKQLDHDFTFYAETRADRLKSEDYTLLKKAGFAQIQTGIESFSQHYLRKMNKGTRVIDNIAALKFCRENGIVNKYNLIINCPNEEPVDFEETEKTVQLFKQYLDPPQLCQLWVLFGSHIYCHPEVFNIEALENAAIDMIMYPQEVLDKGINYVYDFKKKNEFGENDWAKLIEEWKTERERHIVEGIKSKNPIDENIFYFVDGGNFLKIYDKRNQENICVYNLNELEREIFLSCIDIISYQELSEILSHIPDHQLSAILHTFEQKGIVFKEENMYLSLPLSYNKAYRGSKKEKIGQDTLVTQVS